MIPRPTSRSCKACEASFLAFKYADAASGASPANFWRMCCLSVFCKFRGLRECSRPTAHSSYVAVSFQSDSTAKI